MNTPRVSTTMLSVPLLLLLLQMHAGCLATASGISVMSWRAR